MSRRVVLRGVVLAILLRADLLAAQAPSKVDFERDVRPLLIQHCIECHGPEEQRNGLRLDRRSSVLRGGTDPNDLIRGSSETSHLYLRLIGKRFRQMPPEDEDTLSAEEIATFKAWIDQGAEWPDALANEPRVSPRDPTVTGLMSAMRHGQHAGVDRAVAREPRLVNLRGPGGATLLMYATLYGRPQAMRLLLDRRADPNITNDGGATALMWAVRDLQKTRLLLDRGADVNARSSDGRTALTIAAGQPGSTAIVRLLLDRGADPNPPGGAPFAAAAKMGNTEAMEQLLKAGAKNTGPNALNWAIISGCDRCVELAMAATPRPALTTVLSGIVRRGDPAPVRMLLERGADARGQDPLGRTILINAAASEVASADIVKLLLDRGADVHATVEEGASAVSVASRRGDRALVDLLVRAGAKVPVASVPAPTNPRPAPSITEAVQRSLPLLQKADVTFVQRTGCISCHHNSLTAMAVATARGAGFSVDETIARDQLTAIAARQDDWRDRALQGNVLADTPVAVSYVLLGLAAEHYPADATTDAVAVYLLKQQLPDGRWRLTAHRPPMEFSEVTATATSLRALQLYAPRSHAAGAAAAVRAAADWLLNVQPRTSEERNMRLLGLAWAGVHRQAVASSVRELQAQQRPDGGWGQLPTLASDAYATGQSLVALHQAGVSVHDPAYQRGARFLLDHQLEDGSWWVRTRSLPSQVYFESGFPHGVDQWISAAATNWATMALAQAATLAPQPAAAR